MIYALSKIKVSVVESSNNQLFSKKSYEAVQWKACALFYMGSHWYREEALWIGKALDFQGRKFPLWYHNDTRMIWCLSEIT